MAGWQALLGHDTPPRLTLVLGGARSGKSRLAEQLARDACGAELPAYVATAEAWDDEMQDRIARHQADRGTNWHTVEAPIGLPDTLKTLHQPVALVDCLTLWLSNCLLAEHDLEEDSAALLEVLAHRQGITLLVSNEVGLGIVPDTRLGRQFRDAQGTLNQQVAALADCVLLVTAGIPQVLKRP